MEDSMNKTTKKNPIVFKILAAVAFLLIYPWYCKYIFGAIMLPQYVTIWILLAGTVIAAVSVFIPKTRIPSVIGFGAIGGLMAYFLFNNIRTGTFVYLGERYFRNSADSTADMLSPITLFPHLLIVVAIVCALVFMIKGLNERNYHLWYVPGLLGTVSGAVIFAFGLIMIIKDGIYLVSRSVLFGVMYLLIGLGLLFAFKVLAIESGIQVSEKAKMNGEAGAKTSADGYIDMILHVLLLLFTCGIWYLIWVYKTTDYLNVVKGEERRNPVTKLLLCMFIPFYAIYWVYKSCQRIDKLAKEKHVDSDITTICTILEIFISIVPPILMQSKLNAIVTAKAAVPTEAPAQSTQGDVADSLRQLKSLLDDGIITQEEFDAKKKQILGL